MRKTLIALASIAAMLITVLVVPTPAHAAKYYAGYRTPSTSSSKTFYDSWDGTWFKKDSGGQGAIVYFYNSYNNGAMVGKAEFHPYGEWVYVYDTYKDSTAVKVDIKWRYNYTIEKHLDGPLGGKSQGYRAHNLSYDEGPYASGKGLYFEATLYNWKTGNTILKKRIEISA